MNQLCIVSYALKESGKKIRFGHVDNAVFLCTFGVLNNGFISPTQKLRKKKLFIYNWPCIQCKTEYNEPIPDYYCFCGKFKNPEFDRDLEPHSCGQLCERKRGINCPHLCPRICHNGKCNPCEV